MIKIGFFDTILTKLTELLPKINVSLLIGIAGGILMTVVFLLALAFASGSKIDKYRKLLIAGIKLFNRSAPITEDNAEVVYAELKKHPTAVRNGWSAFLERRIGAPSDYLPKNTVLAERQFNGKNTGANLFLALVGALVWAFCGFLGYYYYNVLSAFSYETVSSVIMALEFIIIPVGMYIIYLLSLGIVYGKKYKRMEMCFDSFCETLDNVVAVRDKEEEAFTTENLAEIEKRVAELTERKEEQLMVFALPKTVETEEAAVPIELRKADVQAEPAEPAPADAPAPEEEPTATEETAAAQDGITEVVDGFIADNGDNWVENMVTVMADAIDDPSVGIEAVNTLTAVLAEARMRTDDAHNQEIFALLDDSLRAKAETLNA